MAKKRGFTNREVHVLAQVMGIDGPQTAKHREIAKAAFSRLGLEWREGCQTKAALRRVLRLITGDADMARRFREGGLPSATAAHQE